MTPEQRIERGKKAESLLFRLGQAIEEYSNDRFKEWPEYQEAILFFEPPQDAREEAA